MPSSILLLKVLNYALQAAIYYWFFYRVLDAQRPYRSGLIAFIAFSELTMAADLLLAMSPLTQSAWIRSLFNGILIVLAMRVIFHAPWQKIIFHVFLPFLLLVSFSEVLSLAAARYLIGINVAAVLEIQPAGTAIIYLLANATEACLLVLVSRFYVSGRIVPLETDLQLVLMSAVLFQIIALSAVSYRDLYAAKIGTIPGLILIILFIASNLDAVYLLYSIRKIRRLHEHAMELNVSESRMDSQMRFLKQENAKAAELEQEITEAMSHLEEDSGQAQLAADYHAYRSQEYSDSPVLDTLLKSYAARFQEMEICYTFRIQCSMADAMDPLDLVGIFSNLLDNAMEAVQANPRNHREISLSVRRAANCFSIELNNSLPERHAALSKRVQGEGLKIIREILGRHQGTIDSCAQDGRWHTEVICQTDPDTANSFRSIPV